LATFETYLQLMATLCNFQEIMQLMVIFGIFGNIWVNIGVNGNDFLDFGNGNGNNSAHSQILVTGMGMGMKNYIPNFWEWEQE